MTQAELFPSAPTTGAAEVSYNEPSKQQPADLIGTLRGALLGRQPGESVPDWNLRFFRALRVSLERDADNIARLQPGADF